MLMQLLTLKFGPLPAAVSQAVHAASGDQIQTWAARVLAAGTLDQVLGCPLPCSPITECQMNASRAMIGLADELFAVRDGQLARGYGGTADVLAYAREHGSRHE